MKNKINNNKYLIKTLHEKLWWMDVAYPIFLSITLFCGLTYLIYHGDGQKSIAGKAESQFISFSLRAASPRPIAEQDYILTVSVSERDLAKLSHFDFKGYRDLCLENYLRVVDRLIDLGVKSIFVYWDFDFQDKVPTKELEDLFSKAQGKVTLKWATPPKVRENLKKTISFSNNLSSSLPCMDGVQIYCSYDQDENDWIIQNIFDHVWHEKIDLFHGHRFISTNLPQDHTSYLLYLNAASDFPDFSFSDLLKSNLPRDFFENKIAFVGNSLIQNRLGYFLDLGRVGTALTSRSENPRLVGTPYHIFWAQISQQLLDRALIYIVPLQWSFMAAICFALIVTFCLVYLGTPASLGVYLCLAILAPLINAITIRFFHLYMPLFDIIYAGLCTFILVTFSNLSIEYFRDWRIDFQQKESEEITDVKSNFISLISHNLNTPVAKMQGLLDLLKASNKIEGALVDLNDCLANVACIQHCIRAVLITNALRDNCLNCESITLENIEKELKSSIAKHLLRVGVVFDVILKQPKDIRLLPIILDKRSILWGIASIAMLFKNMAEYDKIYLSVMLNLEHRLIANSSKAEDFLKIEFFSPERSLSALYEKVTNMSVHEKDITKLASDDFMTQVSILLIQEILHTYKGSSVKFDSESVENHSLVYLIRPLDISYQDLDNPLNVQIS